MNDLNLTRLQELIDMLNNLQCIIQNFRLKYCNLSFSNDVSFSGVITKRVDLQRKKKNNKCMKKIYIEDINWTFWHKTHILWWGLSFFFECGLLQKFLKDFSIFSTNNFINFMQRFHNISNHLFLMEFYTIYVVLTSRWMYWINQTRKKN